MHKQLIAEQRHKHIGGIAAKRRLLCQVELVVAQTNVCVVRLATTAIDRAEHCVDAQHAHHLHRDTFDTQTLRH